MSNKITVAFAPDNKYLNQTIVCMFSVLENTKDTDIEFIIAQSNLTKENIEKLQWIEANNNCKVRILQINEQDFENLPVCNWVTIQAWFRAKIPDLCPDINKILYLDCDTLCSGDLKELFKIDLADNYAAVVKDVWDNDKHSDRLQLKSKAYFNSGMMLINAKKYREDNVFEKIKNFTFKLANNKDFADQDALNVVFDEKKIILPQKFNYLETWWRNYYNEYSGIDDANYEIAKREPVIIHYTGLKACFKGCKHSYSSLWWEIAKKSNVYNELKQEFDNSTEPIIKEKLMNKIFSIKNEHAYKNKWKVITILGLKIRIKIK